MYVRQVLGGSKKNLADFFHCFSVDNVVKAFFSSFPSSPSSNRFKGCSLAFLLHFPWQHSLFFSCVSHNNNWRAIPGSTRKRVGKPDSWRLRRPKRTWRWQEWWNDCYVHITYYTRHCHIYFHYTHPHTTLPATHVFHAWHVHSIIHNESRPIFHQTPTSSLSSYRKATTHTTKCMAKNPRRKIRTYIPPHLST